MTQVHWLRHLFYEDMDEQMDSLDILLVNGTYHFVLLMSMNILCHLNMQLNMWMALEVYSEIEWIQYMFQIYLHDYIKGCFSDMD